MRAPTAYRIALPLTVVLLGGLVAMALGGLVVHEGPLLAVAAACLVPAAAYIAARPLNGLLASVAIVVLVPYWYGKGGINVSHLTAALAVVWIVTAMTAPRERLRRSLVDYAVVALVLAAGLDWWLRDQNFTAARASADTIMPLVFYFAGRMAFGRSGRLVLWTVAICAMLASISLFYEFVHGSPVFQDPNSYYWSTEGGQAIFRPGGVFGSPPAAVTILSMVTLITFALAREVHGRRRPLVRLGTALMVGAGILTFTRAGWIGFAAGMIAYLLVLRSRGGMRLPRWVGLVPVAGLGLVVALPVLAGSSWFQEGVVRPGTFAVRESYWSLAGKLIFSSPGHLLLGRGLNSLVAGARPQVGQLSASLAANPSLISAGAHNQYIRTLLEQGAVGLGLILLWLGGTLVLVVRWMPALPVYERRLAAALGGAVVSFLVISLADTNLRDTVSFELLALLTGFAVTLCTRRSAAPEAA